MLLAHSWPNSTLWPHCFIFYSNGGYANAAQCYVIRKLFCWTRPDKCRCLISRSLSHCEASLFDFQKSVTLWSVAVWFPEVCHTVKCRCLISRSLSHCEVSLFDFQKSVTLWSVAVWFSAVCHTVKCRCLISRSLSHCEVSLFDFQKSVTTLPSTHLFCALARAPLWCQNGFILCFCDWSWKELTFWIPEWQLNNHNLRLISVTFLSL